MSDRDATFSGEESEIGGFEPEAAPPKRRPGRAPARRRGSGTPASAREVSGPLDVRQLYMNQIQDIPVLDREAVAQLSNRIREQMALFERSLLEIPGAALRVVAEWESRRSRGLPLSKAWRTHVSTCSSSMILATFASAGVSDKGE